MRARALFFGLFLFTSQVFAIDRWILISGTVSNFHTDARLFNPSFDKDIQVSATFYSTGGGSPLTATVTVPKRQMKILDDVTTQLFSTSSLGAILFTSDDAFEATSRIYALTSAGTLGQFGPGTPPAAAKNKGVLLQLKQNGTGGQSGTFRTNIGIVNINNATANVKWTLYDKNNAIVSTVTTGYAPFAALAPTPLTTIANATSGDFSDAWLSYSSDQPILAYASVVDNGTTDQTFIPAVEDVGVPPTTQPTTKRFDIAERSWSITASPSLTGIKVGDDVTFHIHVIEGPHTFSLVGPTGHVLIPVISADQAGIDKTFQITDQGTYTYFCSNTLCGAGHTSMTGSFTVGKETSDPPGY
jgi:plastocyanin